MCLRCNAAIYLIWIKRRLDRPIIIPDMDISFSYDATRLSQSSTRRVLQSLPLFRELDEGVIVRLARGAVEASLPAGSVVFRLGDTPSAFYLVVDGRVKLSLHTERGDEKVIELVGRGENFGTAALLLGERYTLTAETIADSLLLSLDRNTVLDEVERNAEFACSMLREMCQRLQLRTRDFENCMLLNGAQRVTNFLLDQIPDGAREKTVAITLPAKKGVIASRLNLTHEHFSRILHEIQAAGLIEVRGREIRMFDVGRLRTYPG